MASPATSASSRARSAPLNGRSRLAVASTSSGAMRTTVTCPATPGRGRGGDETGGPQRAHHQPEQRDQSVGRAGHDRLGVLARHEPRREVEADLRLALALLGRAAGLVETRHRPAQHARRSRERDQREQVVALLHVEAFAWRGEEVVQGEERADDADDRADASEERRQQRGHQEQQRGRGEVDVERAGRLRSRSRRSASAANVCRPILTAS